MAQRLVTKEKPVKLTGQAYRNFQSTEAAAKSKEQYERVLVRFMRFVKAKTPDELLGKGEKEYSDKELEDKIADFIETMKKADLARATMRTALWGLHFFFEDANRRALAWGYLAKKIPKKDAKKTKAYTRGQIKEILKQYNIAAVMTDSPDPGLQYLSNMVVTADHAFIRMHGRKPKFWYDYLYGEGELLPWVKKVQEIAQETRIVRLYLNNHPGAKAPYNALKVRQMLGETLSNDEKAILEQLRKHLFIG